MCVCREREREMFQASILDYIKVEDKLKDKKI